MCDLSNEARVAVLGSHEVKGETAGAVQKAGHYTIPFVEAKVSCDWSTQHTILTSDWSRCRQLRATTQRTTSLTTLSSWF